MSLVRFLNEIFSVCGQFHVQSTIQIWGFTQGAPKSWGLTSGMRLPETIHWMQRLDARTFGSC